MLCCQCQYNANPTRPTVSPLVVLLGRGVQYQLNASEHPIIIGHHTLCQLCNARHHTVCLAGVHSFHESSPPTSSTRWGNRIAELESSMAELKAERDRPVDVQEALSLHEDLAKKAPKP